MGVATQPLGENFVLVKVELGGEDVGAEFGVQGGEVGLIEVGEAAQGGLILGIIGDAEHEIAANQGGGVVERSEVQGIKLGGEAVAQVGFIVIGGGGMVGAEKFEVGDNEGEDFPDGGGVRVGEAINQIKE